MENYTPEERQRLIDAHEAWLKKYYGDGEGERIDGPTPNGGDYAVAYYYDKMHRPCKKQDAFSKVIVEYKNNGEYVNTTTSFLLSQR